MFWSTMKWKVEKAEVATSYTTDLVCNVMIKYNIKVL